MAVVRIAALIVLASSCFQGDRPAIPTGVTSWRPEAGGPEGWRMSTVPVDLACPDDDAATLTVVYPAQADGPLPTAVVYPSGAFDYVRFPDPAKPLDGVHFAEPGRLSAAWGARQGAATVGAFPAIVPGEIHSGILAVALAEAGVAVVVPGNCWGDLWGARSGTRDSDIGRDFFRREGAAMAEWSLRVLAEPAFADDLGVQLPFIADADALYAVGLGEGGRGVLEALATDRDVDGVPDLRLVAAVVDSSPDDLRVIFDAPARFPEITEGVRRVFPAGAPATSPGSVWAAPALPERFGYVYSSADPTWPPEVHDAALARLDAARIGGEVQIWVRDTLEPVHVQLSGSDSALARQAVAFLLGTSTTE